jgi:hypothetical protein
MVRNQNLYIFFCNIGIEEAVVALISQYGEFHEVKGRTLYADR